MTKLIQLNRYPPFALCTSHVNGTTIGWLLISAAAQPILRPHSTVMCDTLPSSRAAWLTSCTRGTLPEPFSNVTITFLADIGLRRGEIDYAVRNGRLARARNTVAVQAR